MDITAVLKSVNTVSCLTVFLTVDFHFVHTTCMSVGMSTSIVRVNVKLKLNLPEQPSYVLPNGSVHWSAHSEF